MIEYETNIVWIFDFISGILNDYFILSTKVKKHNLQKVLEKLDDLNEAFCRTIDDLEREFNAETDLEDIKSISEKIEYIATCWKKARQNFDDTAQKGWKLDGFSLKHDIMHTYMIIVANNIESYNKKHAKNQLRNL